MGHVLAIFGTIAAAFVILIIGFVIRFYKARKQHEDEVSSHNEYIRKYQEHLDKYRYNGKK
jgi:hypothetical protein